MASFFSSAAPPTAPPKPGSSWEDLAKASGATFKERIEAMPVVAILAGLMPDRAAEVGTALVDAGITILEVPLRGDYAASLESVRILAATVGERALGRRR